MLIKKNKVEFINCNLAGFSHADGHLVLNEMHPGDKLLMVREEDNKHDHDAIALFYLPEGGFPQGAAMHNIEQYKDAVHVGYIPAAHNGELAMFMDMGYTGIFECTIININRDAHPEQKVRLRVSLLKSHHPHP